MLTALNGVFIVSFITSSLIAIWLVVAGGDDGNYD